MRVLLDTHVLLWTLMEPDRLPPALRDALVDPGHHVMFSAVNIWEIAIKKSLGKTGFHFGPEEVLRAAQETTADRAVSRYAAPIDLMVPQ